MTSLYDALDHFELAFQLEEALCKNRCKFSMAG